MIEVLHVVSTVTTGGVEMVLLNYYRHIDRTRIHWNIATTTDPNKKEKGLAEFELEKLGATIYYLPHKKPNFIKHLYVFSKLLKKHHFDIVHCHLDELCAAYLPIARAHGIKKRISHCHVAYTKRGFFDELAYSVFKIFMEYGITDKFACSTDAATFLYGSADNVFIMHNAIDSNLIKFDMTSRKAIREKYIIKEDEIVMGCVGRFDPQKNHEMLIDIFWEFQKKCNARLLLVGSGVLENDIRNKAKHLDILDKIIFAGTSNNVNALLSAMDCFVMPSRYEGLGIVYIEAQATNLPTYATTERVPHEVNISPNMHFLSINDSPRKWAKDIYDELKNTPPRTVDNTFVEDAGYDIVSAAKILERKYINFYKEI